MKWQAIPPKRCVFSTCLDLLRRKEGGEEAPGRAGPMPLLVVGDRLEDFKLMREEGFERRGDLLGQIAFAPQLLAMPGERLSLAAQASLNLTIFLRRANHRSSSTVGVVLPDEGRQIVKPPCEAPVNVA